MVVCACWVLEVLLGWVGIYIWEWIGLMGVLVLGASGVDDNHSVVYLFGVWIVEQCLGLSRM